MKNFYRRGMIVIMFLITLGLFILILISRADANPIAYKPKGIFQQQINGVVTSQTGKPLIGVTILVKNQMRGTVSNSRGEYEIVANPNDTLVFSFVGYRTQETPINSRTAISIQLAEGISSLDEVEINAGYYNVTQRDRTGNISRVTAEEIEKQPVLNPLAALHGRMPGVEITQATGVPGGGLDIKIRGTNSLRSDGNQPLYIIDGVPYSSSTLGDPNLYAVSTWQGQSPISILNPIDIQSIEILKDADATAIYGSRGANGVVLITTKKGSSGKIKIDVNASTGFGKIANRMSLLNTSQYIEARKEAYENDGINELPSYAYDVNGTWDANRFTDWQDELIGGSAEIYQVGTRISGGSPTTNFLLSTNYSKQTTVFPGNFNYGKGSVHYSFHHRSADNKWNIQLSTNYTTDNNHLPATDFTREALSLAPNAPLLYNPDGSLNWENSTWNNPLRNLNSLYTSKTEGLISNLTLSYEPIKNVKVKSSFGYTKLIFDEFKSVPSTSYDPAYGLSSSSSAAFFNKANNNSWIIEPQILYENKFGHHEINMLAGITLQEDSSEKFVELGVGFPSNDLITNIAAASNNYLLSNEKGKYRYSAIFGRLNYKFKDRYILNLTGRRDGSSRFGPGRRFSNFGAIGGAWLFGNENLFENSFLSFGKLRVSYGITGNDQIGDYQYLDTYAITSNKYNGVSGLAPTRLFNPNFGWESNKKLEIGLELGFLEDHLFTSLSYFRNRSSNQLVGIPLAATTGFSSIQANLDATVENMGWEFEFNSQIIQKKSFAWSSSFNLTIPKNKLIKFPGLVSSTYANKYVIGKPLDISKVYEYTGLDKETGLYTFRDFNNDGLISASEDKQAIVRFNTDYFGGLSNHLKVGDFSLDFSFQYVKQKGYNFLLTSGYPLSRSNQPEEILDRWQNPGDDAKFQRFTSGASASVTKAFSNYSSSDAAVSNASYIRLKNIFLNYQLPEKWIKGIDSNIYIQGQNILTITNYMGLDPETQIANRIPPLRIIAAGINVSF